jgi:putative ABC transport system permease protein
LGESDQRLLMSYLPDVLRATITKKRSGVQFFYGDNSASADFLGIDSSFFFVDKVKLGIGRDFLADEHKDQDIVVILGSSVAEKTFGKSNALYQHIRVNLGEAQLFAKVVGVLKPIGSNQDLSVLIPNSTFDSIVNANISSQLILQTKSSEVTQQTRMKASALMVSKYQDSVFIYDAASAIESSKKIFENIGMAGVLLALISLITGGIGIMNVMLLSIAQRKKEIGLRKALGAKPRNVLTQFLLEAVLICLAGAIIGSVIGVGISFVFAKYMDVEPVVSIQTVLIAFSFSILTGIIFGLLPAKKAAALDPYEALRS